MAGTMLAPASWPVWCTQGDLLLVETVPSVEREDLSTGVITPAVITGVVAQVRRERDRGSELVLDLAPTFAGASFSWGGVRVPDDPGVWWWDVQVTGTFGGVPFDVTVLAGSFAIGRDVSHV